MIAVTPLKKIKSPVYQQEFAVGSFAKTTSKCYEYASMTCVIINFDDLANSYRVHLYVNAIIIKVWIHRNYLTH
jgi:hypothetical protein